MNIEEYTDLPNFFSHLASHLLLHSVLRFCKYRFHIQSFPPNLMAYKNLDNFSIESIEFVGEHNTKFYKEE